MQQRSCTLFIVDADALVCCSQHLHSHGCKPKTVKEYLERIKQEEGEGQRHKFLDLIVDSLTKVNHIAGRDKREGVTVVVVNGRTCSEKIVEMFEILLTETLSITSSAELFLEIHGISHLLANAEICPSDTCRSTECKLLCWEKLGTCLGKTTGEDCKTIEARVSCILDLVCGGGLHHSIPCSVNGIVAVFCYSGSLNVDVSCERLIKHWENFPCNINGNADVHHIVMVY